MSIKSGWQGALYWAWEGTLGNAGILPDYKLWQAEDSDTLSLNETPATRRPIFGKSWDMASIYTRAAQLPGGMPGTIPLAFNTDGSHLELIRLFRNHFQYNVKVISGTNISQACWPKQESEPSGGWTGFSMIKDWSNGSYIRYTGGVVDTLTISWAAAKPYVTMKPTLKFLSGTAPGTYTGSLVTTARQFGLVTPGNMTVTLNGTNINPASFEIVSNMHFLDQISPSSAGRNGFACGPYQCDIKVSTWIGDDFFPKFMETFASQSIGTLIFTLNTPPGLTATEHAPYGECIITAYVVVQNYAPMALKRGAGIETVSFLAVCPDGVTQPVMANIFTKWSATSIK